MRRPRFSRFLVLAAAGVTAAGLAACSSGSTSSTAASGTTSGSGLEKTTVTVDATDSPDAGPLWIAQNDGFFKQQGLTVKINYVPGTAAAFPAQAAHTVDFAEQNYVSFFSENQTNPALGLRIIAPDEQAAPNTNVIMVPKNSPIKTSADLKGKKVAFPAPGVNLSNLGVEEQMQGYGIKPPKLTVEVAAGVALAVAAARSASAWQAAALCWLMLCAVALTFIDIAVRRLPDPLTGGAFVGVLGVYGVAALAGGHPGQLGRAAVAAAALCGFYLLLFLIRPSGMGLGDIKLAASLGAALGWQGWQPVAAATFLTFVAAAFYGIALLVLRRATRTTQFPLGPFMVLGALAAILA